MPDLTTTNRRGFFRLLGGAAVASVVPVPAATADIITVKAVEQIGCSSFSVAASAVVRRSVREKSFASQILTYAPVA
jgi:hypothetical protein